MNRLVVLSVALTALAVGVVLAWYNVRQEREFQRLIAAGDAALADARTYGDAIEAFSGALALKPGSMLAYLKRGDTYRRRGELNAALRDLRDAAALDPSAPRPRELLGDVEVATGRYDEAVEHYRAFTQLDDRSPRVLYKLAVAHFRGGYPDRAVQRLQQALAIDDRHAAAHYLLALCLREMSQEDDARHTLIRAIEIDPALTAAREALAEVYQRGGRPRESIEQLEALAALEPSRAERLIAVALAYARWGRIDAAMAALARASDRFPDSPAVSVAAGRIWLAVAERGQDDGTAARRAVEALQDRATRADASGEILMLYGRALQLSGDVAEAERILRQATARLPVEPAAYRYLSDASEQLGRASEARDALRRYHALVSDPSLEPSLLRQR